MMCVFIIIRKVVFDLDLLILHIIHLFFPFCLCAVAFLSLSKLIQKLKNNLLSLIYKTSYWFIVVYFA